MSKLLESVTISERLNKQIRFMMEVDKLKTILRRNHITSHRRENTAEHSWHITLFALILAEYSNQEIDVLKVLKMLLIHDIVEIDAGDTFVYDTEGAKDKMERELLASERIFGLLPHDQKDELQTLWKEFEDRQSPESQFAAALDRLNPMLMNVYSEGKTWIDHSISVQQVYNHNQHIAEGSQELWDFARQLIEFAAEQQYLQR